jgi:transcriptional regulator with XRE-family HTH domain
VGESRFGKEIARLRRKKQYTIREFAKKVLKEDGEPMSPSYLCDIEQGRRKPASEVIKRMAALLDANFDDLMALAQRTPPDIKEMVRENKMLRRVLRRAKEIGFKDWKEVEELIEKRGGTQTKASEKRMDKTEDVGE